MRVADLLFDEENPRLSSLLDGSKETQEELLRILWDEMSVDELVLSVAANGFFEEEPLFVIPAKGGKYTVLEGNRRLAAVNILLHDNLRDKLRIDGMPTLSPADKKRLESLPVSVYQTREELWAFLSFRHINSAKQWDAYSKAKYIAHVHEEYGIPLLDIAKRIGDRHATVLRMYRGYRVLQQAEQSGAFAVSDATKSRFAFSHLYTAINYEEYREFLGLSDANIDKRNPVPKSHKTQLRELLLWLYGSRENEVQPVVTKQNPDLNQLRQVVAAPQALNALRRGYGLDRAYRTSVGDALIFSEALTSAKQELQVAKSTVATGYKGETSGLELAEELCALATSLHGEMKGKSAGRRK